MAEIPANFKVLGTRIDAVQIPDVITAVEGWINAGSRGNYIVISNANDVMTGKTDDLARKAANASNLSVPDGISLVLLGRLYGHRLKKRVYGPDLMLEFLELSVKRGYTNFFYGATDSILEKLKDNLAHRFPGIKVAGSYAPPFKELTPEEEAAIIKLINSAAPDVLWVGLGCPKQQLWMYKHKSNLKVPAMIGVGAAFDFISGNKPQAPVWIRNNGFEWLFRLATEPKRLWKRYLGGGSQFIYYAGKEFFSCRVLTRKKHV
ncbi:MAG: WecB/TagA/CpsF family glycosyltransferase [Candidatus Omnitrophota bacterium]